MPTNHPQRLSCTDPIVGAILSGWRYDISNISPEMRTEYESHLEECTHCQHRQHLARSIDVLLLSVTSLSFVAFALAAVVLRRWQNLTHHPEVLTLHVHQAHLMVSLEFVAIMGIVLSMVLSALVAIATPVPSIIGNVVRTRIHPDLRERFARRHAA